MAQIKKQACRASLKAASVRWEGDMCIALVLPAEQIREAVKVIDESEILKS